MKKPILFSLTAAALLFVAGCSSDDDENKPDNGNTDLPEVTLNEPDNGAEFEPGGSFHVEGTVAGHDLSELRISIHWADDGHTHGKKASMEWSEERIVALSGNNDHFHEDMDIPADAKTGTHHLILDALDNNGNRSDRVEIDVAIQEHDDNGHGPELSLTTPDHDGEQDVNGGDVIEIKGTASDDDHKLENLHIELLDTEDGNNVVDDVHVHGIDAHSLNIDESVTVPAANDGHYELHIVIENEEQEQQEKVFKYAVGN